MKNSKRSRLVTVAPITVDAARGRGGNLHLTVGHANGPLTLSRMMPVVESFGLEVLSEHSDDTPQGWTHTLHCLLPGGFEGHPMPSSDMLASAVADGLNGKAEVDNLNSLMLTAGLEMVAIGGLRALTAYLQQVDRRLDPAFTRKTLTGRPTLTALLWTLLEGRHKPGSKQINETSLLTKLDDAMALVKDGEADRVFSTLRMAIEATLRTNLWQDALDGQATAFKLDSAKIAVLPEPKPWREIFVYHASMEGIHLRDGAVARGGIRYSDRLNDYRTEVLGLMAAQVRKNTIIVPTGSKGGFVVKDTLSTDPAEARQQVRAAYGRYIRAMLSITDSRVGAKVVAPRNVVCRDGDDPYLVVAADKGTARFSDLANDTAMACDFWPRGKGSAAGFWLGDAFASGGRNGYEHKQLGITARGAWVSVMHHLRGLGIIPSTARPIKVIGIGDMAGDVFGNGLLQSTHVQLVAAFNHSHIFLDPAPDPASSFTERKNLYADGLNWDGYRAKAMSPGGGVYPRNEKTLTLEPAALKMLGLSGKVTPNQVIKAILGLNVDVLWNGGIGTFVKASTETHADVADRANDDIRVDATAVRAKVIGEGGNLGISPRGRNELAMLGVRLNSDAVDNSAGVSTSDHEVNLKLLFMLAQHKGKLTEKGRLALLPQLAGDVCALVLADNHLQNTALTLEEQAPMADHAELLMWQREMMRRGVLDPSVDILPDFNTLTHRPTGKYVRPELASLLAGSKTALRTVLNDCGDLLRTGLADQLLYDYFPPMVHQKLGKLVAEHPLADDIKATGLANLIVNRCGLLMGQRLQGDFSCTPADSVRALTVAICLLDARSLWAALDAVEDKLEASTLVSAHARIRGTLLSLSSWVLAQGQPVDALKLLQRTSDDVADANAKIATLLPPKAAQDMVNRVASWEKQGLPPALARRLAILSLCAMTPEAVLLAQRQKQPIAKVLKLVLAVGEALRLPAVTLALRSIPLPDRWTRQAVQTMVREMFFWQVRLAGTLLKNDQQPMAWLEVCGESCGRYHALVDALLLEGKPTVAMASVLLARLRELEQD